MLPFDPRTIFSKPLDWIQVEVTSDCDAACSYCPRTLYRPAWPKRYFPLEDFQRLAPIFPKTRHVHLQGWGEPFLHPEFFEMVALAKNAGCRVGTTTNGMKIDRERAERLVRSGLDVIAFSLAGTGAANDAIRKGTHLSRVLEAMRCLDREKQRSAAAAPAIHVAYMLLRSGLKELEKLPDILQGTGVAEVVISFLDFVPSEELQSEAIEREAAQSDEAIRLLLAAVKAKGRRIGLSFHHPLDSGNEKDRGCTENVQRALCIASDGSVTPCVYRNLQVPRVVHLLKGQKQVYERLVFGNVKETPLPAIWESKAFRTWRDSLGKSRLPPFCRDCPKRAKSR